MEKRHNVAHEEHGVSNTLKMKPVSDEDDDASTVDVDYEVTDEETAHHDCCIHCPLLKEYLHLHGKWPTDHPITSTKPPTED
jgi:hypothetical protein